MSVSSVDSSSKCDEKSENSDNVKFSVTFEIPLEKQVSEYAISSTLTYMDTKWSLRFYPYGIAKDSNENASIALYFQGAGSIVADCTLTILNQKHSNWYITQVFKDVTFKKHFPENSVGFNTCGSTLLHSKYGYFSNGLLNVKADIVFKSSLNASKENQLCS